MKKGNFCFQGILSFSLGLRYVWLQFNTIISVCGYSLFFRVSRQWKLHSVGRKLMDLFVTFFKSLHVYVYCAEET